MLKKLFCGNPGLTQQQESPIYVIQSFTDQKQRLYSDITYNGTFFAVQTGMTNATHVTL
jgi:hypothetical protein